MTLTIGSKRIKASPAPSNPAARLAVRGKIIDGVSLVTFDKDGTLIDLYYYWSHMVAYRAEQICALFDLKSASHKRPLMEAMGIDVRAKRIKKDGPVGLHPRTVV